MLVTKLFQQREQHMNKHLLPEWHHQYLQILTWPHINSDWKDILFEVEEEYIELARAILECDNLLVIALDPDHTGHIINTLHESKTNVENLLVIEAETNDTWVRDYGPLSCNNNGKIEYLNFQYNAYGNKYSHNLDNKVNYIVKNHKIISNLTDIDFVLEGGAIETNGLGLLLATKSSVLNNNRNQLTEQQIINTLQQNLGVKQVYFLDHVELPGDDTDGHIDNLVRFINPTTILYLDDAHLYKQLEQLNYSNNNQFTLIPVTKVTGNKSGASYLNFIFTNHKILVPSFGVKSDQIALACFEKYAGKRKVELIPANKIVTQGGGLHCSSMQLANII